MFCVMNIQKRKKTDITGIEREATRTATEYNNAVEPGMDIYNVNLIESMNWRRDIEREISQTGAKMRANSVIALDTVYTASADFFKGIPIERQMQFFRDCLSFHQRQFGHVVSAVVHYDETTPHMHIMSVPLTRDGRLSAREIVGNKVNLSRIQTEFFEQVGKGYGLERGVHRDSTELRKHTTAQEWRLQQVTEQVQEQEQRLYEIQQGKKSELEALDAIKHSKTHARARAEQARQQAQEQALRNQQAVIEGKGIERDLESQRRALHEVKKATRQAVKDLHEMQGYLAQAEQRRLDELSKEEEGWGKE